VNMWKRAAATLCMTLAATVVAASTTAGVATAQWVAPTEEQPTAHPAAADDAVRPLATNLTYIYWGYWEYGNDRVYIWWGYDYNPANNHLRAWARMFGNDNRIHVQAEPLNLGDRNGVLASKRANSQTGSLEVSTAAVDCHSPNGVYRSNLHYSIRWPDGRLTSNQQTGQFEASAPAICWT
jgi:hypothetical protein